MSLSRRDSVMVKAALAEMRHLGHDPSEVSGLAARMIQMGTPARKAYERAFDKFVARVPAAHAPIQRIGQLVEATDPRTIASYNVALDRYGSTGDPQALQPILQTVQQDLRTMAQRTGDAGFADGLPDLSETAQELTPNAPQDSPARPGWGALGFQPGEARQDAPQGEATTE